LNEKNEDRDEPTEYAKATKLIVEKQHAPVSETDKNIHTNIPQSIFTNLIQMGGIEHGLRKLFEGDQVLIHAGGDTVTIQKIDPLTGDLIPYRTMSMKSYYRSQFVADVMAGYNGTIKEQLMSIDGWRSEQAVQEIASLTNSEKLLMEAGQGNTGIFRKALRKAFGK
jgi:hypothetical protein